MGKVLWGILFVVVGIVIGMNSFGITDIDLFFNGWWTLFIIVPCFIGLFSDREGKTGNLIGLLIGVFLLLACQDIVSFEFISKLIVPVILILIGFSMIFNHTIKNKVSEKIQSKNKDNLESIVATFSGQNVVKDGEKFEGVSLDAVFGSVELDLRKAKIEKEAIITASAIFGGIDIMVPEDVSVVVKSTPIFGGVSNKSNKNKDSKKIIYIEAFCMFGGVEIK